MKRFSRYINGFRTKTFIFEKKSESVKNDAFNVSSFNFKLFRIEQISRSSRSVAELKNFKLIKGVEPPSNWLPLRQPYSVQEVMVRKAFFKQNKTAFKGFRSPI